jgi:hypothetical protein
VTTSAPSQTAEPATSAYAKAVIALFFVALVIPGSFQLGVRMTTYRLFLILMAVPTTIRFLQDPGLRVTAVDVFVFLAVLWQSLAIVVNNGTDQIFFAGSIFVELFFAYLLGRAFVRSAADYRYFFQCFLGALAFMLPFALLEAATHVRVLRRIAGAVLTQPEEVELRGAMIRFGLLRAQAAFDHPILFGLFCATAFINVYYVFRLPMSLVYAAFTGFVTFLSISSSSLLALAIQIGLAVYEKIFRRFPAKWVVLGVGSLVGWFAFEWIFGVTVIEYLITELVFNQAGAETRIDQIVYGLKEIERSPFFGIGLNEVALPFWRGNVIDNYWLLVAIRSGVPALLFLAIAFALHFLRAARVRDLTPQETRIRLGYLIAFFTLVLVVGSVTIWGIALVFVYLYFGIGTWIYEKAPAPRLAARGPRPARGAPVRPGGAASAAPVRPGPVRPGLGGRATSVRARPARDPQGAP